MDTPSDTDDEFLTFADAISPRFQRLYGVYCQLPRTETFLEFVTTQLARSRTTQKEKERERYD